MTEQAPAPGTVPHGNPKPGARNPGTNRISRPPCQLTFAAHCAVYSTFIVSGWLAGSAVSLGNIGARNWCVGNSFLRRKRTCLLTRGDERYVGSTKLTIPSHCCLPVQDAILWNILGVPYGRVCCQLIICTPNSGEVRPHYLALH